MSLRYLVHMEDLLKLTQKHGNDCIPIQVVKRTFLEEDICFINENDSAPLCGCFEDTRESPVQLSCGRPEISCTHDI